MLAQNYPARPQQHSLCVLMATRTESAAFSSLQTSPGLAVVRVGCIGHRPAPPGSTKSAWKWWFLCFPRVQASIPGGFHHSRGVQSIILGGFHHPRGVQNPTGLFIILEVFPSNSWGFHHPSRVCSIPPGFPSSWGAQSIIPLWFLSSWGIQHPIGVSIIPGGFSPSSQGGFHHSIQSLIPVGFP